MLERDRRSPCGRALSVFGVAIVFATGCTPSPAAPQPSRAPAEASPPTRTVSHETMVAVAQREALRLLKETLHVDGHVGQGSEVQEATTWTFYVTFSDVSDTIAVIVVDARSGAIVSSKIGGGP